MERAPPAHVVTAQQRLDFEQYKLLKLREQQEVERILPHARPEMLATDIADCEHRINTGPIFCETTSIEQRQSCTERTQCTVPYTQL